MRTLSKNITSRFFVEEDGYNKLQARWAQAVQSDERHTLEGTHHLAYAILRGKDWTKCFTEVTNERKLRGGMSPTLGRDQAMDRLYRALKHPVFQDAVPGLRIEDFLGNEGGYNQYAVENAVRAAA